MGSPSDCESSVSSVYNTTLHLMLKEYQERGLQRLVRARGLGQVQCDTVFWTIVGCGFYELLAVRLPTKDLQMRSQPHWLELLESS